MQFLDTLFDILINYKEGFIQGLKITFLLCFTVWCIGISLGTIIGILGYKSKRIIGFMSKIVSNFISGIPVLVLLYWLYYPLQQQLNIDIDPFIISLITFSFINTFMVADIVKNAIENLPKQYILSAKISGMSTRKTIFKIQIPLIFKQIIGSVLLVQITMLHNSIFSSLINVDDIFRQIQRVNSVVYKPIELYTSLAIFFLAITIPLNLLANYLTNKYTRDLSER